jgi:hypothetical protein
LGTVLASKGDTNGNDTMMFKHLTWITALGLFTLAACRKEDKVDPDLDYTTAVDNARAEDYFTDLLSAVDDAAEANGLRAANDACAPTVTIDTLVMPHTMIIDFGPVNCTASNGRMRRGILNVTFTGRYRDVGTVITITPQDYYVNDNHVEGTKTVTNMGLNNDGDPWFTVAVSGTVTASDGSWTATHQANRTRTWVQGDDTLTPFDDVYLITGSGSGVNRNGLSYTVSITQALRVAIGCPWITAGTVEIVPSGKPARTINYGSGSCDGSYSVTVNGTTFTVVLV